MKEERKEGHGQRKREKRDINEGREKRGI